MAEGLLWIKCCGEGKADRLGPSIRNGSNTDVEWPPQVCAAYTTRSMLGDWFSRQRVRSKRFDAFVMCAYGVSRRPCHSQELELFQILPFPTKKFPDLRNSDGSMVYLTPLLSDISPPWFRASPDEFSSGAVQSSLQPGLAYCVCSKLESKDRLTISHSCNIRTLL